MAFPVGIWAVLLILILSGGVFTIFSQGLSLLNRGAALSMRLQGDSRTSGGSVEKTIGAMYKVRVAPM